MAKRLFDLLGALVSLLLLAPLMVGIALAVKLDSRGPVLFRQERVGRHGRPFRIHKFRTMRHDPSQLGPLLTAHADPRVTRVGAFLRRRRLDELPQFLDVLKGDMSLVGPRPEVPRYVALYPAELRERVLAVRPGITDPSSLEFMDEGALLAKASDPEREYVDVILPRKLRRAAEYADRATLWTDLLVIGRTMRALARRERRTAT